MEQRISGSSVVSHESPPVHSEEGFAFVCVVGMCSHSLLMAYFEPPFELKKYLWGNNKKSQNNTFSVQLTRLYPDVKC